MFRKLAVPIGRSATLTLAGNSSRTVQGDRSARPLRRSPNTSDGLAGYTVAAGTKLFWTRAGRSLLVSGTVCF